MPRGDRTGPLGQGPATGRGLGPCGRGLARGRGFGRGYGRGFAWRAPNYQKPLTREEDRKLLEAEKAEIEQELKELEKIDETEEKQ